MARQKWDSVYGELQRLLRMGAELCLSHGKITQKDRDKYFVSGELKSVLQDSVIRPIVFVIYCIKINFDKLFWCIDYWLDMGGSFEF